jgi:uncharacterized protein
VDGDPELDAGALSSWLRAMRGALRGERASDVPCGACTACCASHQFVQIGPDETDTLAHIPAALLVAAPRLPRGHVVLGYDEHGRCPMLTDGGCSVYEHRPSACRTYDCRVFAATGVDPGDDQPMVRRQARRWRFDLPTDADRALHGALRAAAAFLREHPEESPDGTPPANATGLAVLAVETHEEFLGSTRRPGRGGIASP